MPSQPRRKGQRHRPVDWLMPYIVGDKVIFDHYNVEKAWPSKKNAFYACGPGPFTITSIPNDYCCELNIPASPAMPTKFHVALLWPEKSADLTWTKNAAPRVPSFEYDGRDFDCHKAEKIVLSYWCGGQLFYLLRWRDQGPQADSAMPYWKIDRHALCVPMTGGLQAMDVPCQPPKLPVLPHPSPASTPAVGQQTGFLQLPAEIRNNVYAYLLQSQDLVPVQSTRTVQGCYARPQWCRHSSLPAISLMSVNKQICYETSSFFYGNNAFEMTALHLPLFLQQIGDTNSKYLRNLYIKFFFDKNEEADSIFDWKMTVSDFTFPRPDRSKVFIHPSLVHLERLYLEVSGLRYYVMRRRQYPMALYFELAAHFFLIKASEWLKAVAAANRGDVLVGARRVKLVFDDNHPIGACTCAKQFSEELQRLVVRHGGLI